MCADTPEDTRDRLEDRELSLLIADVVDYSELESYELQAFFTEILPEIADILKSEDVRSRNSWGDGIIGVFENPEKAARSALEIRDYFKNNNWTDSPLSELEIRIGLHNGVVYEGHNPVREENDVVGANVNLAARIEPIVPPNHIFVTEIFRNSIESSIRDNQFDFDDPYEDDEIELAKGWGRENIYNLRWEDDRSISPDEIPSSSEDEEIDPTEEANALKSFLDSGSTEEQKMTVDILAERGNLESIDVLTSTLQDIEGTRGDIRQRIAAQLSEIRDERVIDPLIDSVRNDPQMSVANNAINSINELAENGVVNGRVIETFESVISGNDQYPDRLRVQAAKALGQVQDQEAIVPLRDALENEGNIVELRQSAAMALSNFSDKRAMEPLIKSSQDDQSEIKAQSIQSLSSFPNEKAAEKISEILRNEDEELGIRVISAEILSEFDNTTEPNEALISSLDTSSPKLRATAARSIGELGVLEARSKLEELLLDSSEPTEVRSAAATALGDLGVYSSTDSLCEAFEAPEVEVKQRVISALGQIDSKQSLEKLIEIMKDESEFADVRDVAILSLQDLDKRESVGDLIDMCDSEDIELQRSALQVLGVLGTPEAVEKITSVYKNEEEYDVPARTHAAVALRRVDNNRLALQTLIEGLESFSNGRVINSTLQTLSVMESSESTEPIAEVVSDDSHSIQVREVGLFTLGLIADPSVEKTLVEIACDRAESWRIRKLALRAIGSLGTHSGNEILNQVATDDDEPARANIFARRFNELPAQQIREDLRQRRDEMVDQASAE